MLNLLSAFVSWLFGPPVLPSTMLSLGKIDCILAILRICALWYAKKERTQKSLALGPSVLPSTMLSLGKIDCIRAIELDMCLWYAKKKRDPNVIGFRSVGVAFYDSVPRKNRLHSCNLTIFAFGMEVTDPKVIGIWSVGVAFYDDVPLENRLLSCNRTIFAFGMLKEETDPKTSNLTGRSKVFHSFV